MTLDSNVKSTYTDLFVDIQFFKLKGVVLYRTHCKYFHIGFLQTYMFYHGTERLCILEDKCGIINTILYEKCHPTEYRFFKVFFFLIKASLANFSMYL